MSETQIEIEGFEIQYDASGVGHNWRPAGEHDLPLSIREEIAAEIIDGGKDHEDSWNEYKATNGINYRW